MDQLLHSHADPATPSAANRDCHSNCVVARYALDVTRAPVATNITTTTVFPNERSKAMHYKGSCHCGQIAFEVEGELTQVADCNCSICTRMGALH